MDPGRLWSGAAFDCLPADNRGSDAEFRPAVEDGHAERQGVMIVAAAAGEVLTVHYGRRSQSGFGRAHSLGGDRSDL
jgi:hypothetical protein